MAHFFTSLVIRGKRDHIMREEMAATRCVSETQTRSPVHMVSARGETAELFCCHWLREERLLPARPTIGCRGEQRSAYSSHPCYSRVRIQKPHEPRRIVARAHTTDSEIKEIDLLGSNLINPTSRKYQSIIILNADHNS